MKLLRMSAGIAVWFAAALSAAAGDYVLDTFQRVRLSDVYYSEGANFGDLNRDGAIDVVCGPYWYAGPDYRTRREIYPAVPQPTEFYADNFFSWLYDVNGDGWNDVLTVGFPGKPAYVYVNPAGAGFEKHWARHDVVDSVHNESPHFTNLVGDERPELVHTRDGYFGYSAPDWNKPLERWTFHAISEQVAPKAFGHGLGVGDVNGDGRADVIAFNGWFEQPESLADDPVWAFHPVAFGGYGGAEMHAYDVDGDGDADIITSLNAHDFGLAWFEQVAEGGEVTFKPHLIMGETPEQNRYGLVFSEPHSVNLADIDGDGLKDIVTGKTYYSHHKRSPMWDAGAVVYWFKLARTEQGVDWVPHEADGESGIGRQLSVGDITGDGLPDIVVGGMKGAHVLLHRREKVSREKWLEAQPKPR